MSHPDDDRAPCSPALGCPPGGCARSPEHDDTTPTNPYRPSSTRGEAALALGWDQGYDDGFADGVRFIAGLVDARRTAVPEPRWVIGLGDSTDPAVCEHESVNGGVCGACGSEVDPGPRKATP